MIGPCELRGAVRVPGIGNPNPAIDKMLWGSWKAADPVLRGESSRCEHDS
jgi:hypothetical protein